MKRSFSEYVSEANKSAIQDAVEYMNRMNKEMKYFGEALKEMKDTNYSNLKKVEKAFNEYRQAFNNLNLEMIDANLKMNK